MSHGRTQAHTATSTRGESPECPPARTEQRTFTGAAPLHLTAASSTSSMHMRGKSVCAHTLYASISFATSAVCEQGGGSANAVPVAPTVHSITS